MVSESYNSHTRPVRQPLSAPHLGIHASEKKDQWPRPSQPGLKMCFLTYNTVSNTLNGVSLNTNTWPYIWKQCYPTSTSVMGNLTVNNHIWLFPYQKPLMNNQVKTLLKKSTTPWGLETKTHTVLPDPTWRQESRKLKQNTDSRSEPTSPTTIQEINSFFTRLETSNPQSATTPSQHLPASSSQPLTMQAQEVERILSRVNPRKASGPEGMVWQVWLCCTTLKGLHHNFQPIPVTIHHAIPSCLKSVTIIPVPQNQPSLAKRNTTQLHSHPSSPSTWNSWSWTISRLTYLLPLTLTRSLTERTDQLRL